MTEKKTKRHEIPLPPDYTLWKRVTEPIRLTWALFWDNEVPAFNKILPIIGLAYVLSPIGMIAEAIPIIGQLDNLGVLLITCGLFVMASPRYLREKHLRRIRFGQPYYVHKDADGVVIDVTGQVVPDDEDEAEDPEEAEAVEADESNVDVADEAEAADEGEPDQEAEPGRRHTRRGQ